MSIWVVNTSPLVFLGSLGRLELLCHEGREVYIPRAVAEEIAEKPDAAAQAVQAACGTWMQVRNVTDQTAVTLVQAALHKGEAEAIVLAAEVQAERLVLDDQDARRFADRCGLKVIGTLGILLAAKQRGVIASLRAEINALVALGLRSIHNLSLPYYKVQGSNVHSHRCTGEAVMKATPLAEYRDTDVVQSSDRITLQRHF